MAAAEIYVECLSHLRHGYPLYIPEPVISANTGDDFNMVDGVGIGDVGIIGPEGDFDCLFDICDKPSRSLRARGVEANDSRSPDSGDGPSTIDDVGGLRLTGTVESSSPRNDATSAAASGNISSSAPADQPAQEQAQVGSAAPEGLGHIDAGEIRIDTNFLNSEYPCLAYGREEKRDAMLGATVTFSEITANLVPLEAGASWQFECSSQKGAVAVAPNGAISVDAPEEKRFLKCLDKIPDWFDYAENIRERTLDNNSLTLVTGVVKCSMWGVAALLNSSSSNGGQLSLSLTPAVSVDASSSHSWSNYQPTMCGSGPKPRSEINNQCLFIRGYRIMKQDYTDRKRGTVKVTNLRNEKPTPHKITKPDSRGTSGSGSAPNTRFLGTTQGGSGSDLTDGYVTEKFPDAHKLYHPSDIINRYLLDQFPQAQFAMTHDKDWWQLIKDTHHTLPNDIELLNRLCDTYRFTHELGVVYLERLGSSARQADAIGSLESSKLTHSSHEFVGQESEHSTACMEDAQTASTRQIAESSDLVLAEESQNAEELCQVAIPNVSRKYPKLDLPTKLFALVIGIDDYQHWTPLKGAVKDANDIENFLVNSLSVPPNHIKKLLNGDATKDRIIRELQAFSTNSDINKERGDAILIYFAGHGSFCAPPEGWESRGNQIEMICPVDISCEEQAESRITGIPDIILNLLISQLAVDKGDNITVIFDCCHSSSAIRDGASVSQSNIRGIDNPPPLTGNWDDGIMRARGKVAPDKYTNSLDCAVLLAACGKGEKAGDGPQGGHFTQRLLKEMGGEGIDLAQLSYNGLMRNLTISKIQHPQCESSKSNRYLFRKETENRSYIYGSKEDGKFVLDAGKLQGIKEGAEFDIFGKNYLSPDNAHRYRFRVAEVKKKTSYLMSLTAPTPSNIPDHFYALQTSFAEGQKIRVYCSDYKRLDQLLLQRQADFAGFVTLVGKRDEAVVVVSFEGDCICFDWHEINIITKHAGSRIGSPVPVEEKEKIIRIFQAVAKFNYYLDIEGADAQHIQLHLQRMVMKSQDIEGKSRPVRMPEGNNLLEQEPAAIKIEKGETSGPLVLTISNSSKRDLYPQVIWFEGRTLAIDPWYIGQRGAGPKEVTAEVDIPLPAGGKCPVGYGDVPVQPWEFLLEDGHPDVGFFKVFLATFNTNVSSFAQASPFDESDKDRAVRMVKLTPITWWATKKATILQSVNE